jgi:hypothetical protein
LTYGDNSAAVTQGNEARAAFLRSIQADLNEYTSSGAGAYTVIARRENERLARFFSKYEEYRAIDPQAEFNRTNGSIEEKSLAMGRATQQAVAAEHTVNEVVKELRATRQRENAQLRTCHALGMIDEQTFTQLFTALQELHAQEKPFVQPTAQEVAAYKARAAIITPPIDAEELVFVRK